MLASGDSGELIGHEGNTISDIRKKSEASLSLATSTTPSAARLLIIKGTDEGQVRRAMQLIEQTIGYECMVPAQVQHEESSDAVAGSYSSAQSCVRWLCALCHEPNCNDRTKCLSLIHI